jgi:hypothetical protein
MPIEFKKNLATFKEVASVEEAEVLLDWLQKQAAGKINLARCTHLHPANLQVLMAANASISAWPNDKNLAAWLASALQSE